MITQRAFFVAVVSVCFYIIALVNNLPNSYYALTWLSASVLVSSFGVSLLSLVGLDCRWQVAKSRVAENVSDGSPNGVLDEESLLDTGPLLEVELSNAGTLNKTGVVLLVRLRHVERDEVMVRRFLLEALPSGAAIVATLALHSLPRGRYVILDVRLIGSDVLGLFHVRRRVLSADEVASKNAMGKAGAKHGAKAGARTGLGLIVGPAMVSLSNGVLNGPGGDNHSGPMHAQGGTLGPSADIRGIRAYVAGDDLRHVHWKSTARRGELVVKEFERASQTSCVVVWDGAAETTWGEDNATSTEWSLRLAASLCRAIVERGRPCALWRLDEQPMRLGGGDSNGAAFGAVPQASFLSGVLEVLATAEATRTTLLSREMEAGRSALKSGTMVFVVTASLHPDMQRALLQCRATGLDIRVALVDGAAFLPVTSARSAPQQHWTGEGKQKGGRLPVMKASYDEVEEALRGGAIPVVRVAPDRAAPDEARHYAVPLRAALRDLLSI